jgi:SAM-dependent methyltransferase
MQWFANFALEYFNESPDTVLDIGCNDGTQLNYFKKLGVKTYGIDPAENLLQFSGQNHTIVCDFFNAQTAAEFAKLHGKVDCVVAQNSFAHNPNPLEYLRSLKQLINPNGLFFIQTSQANMVLNKEFDTIYHEHVNFYNINSMRALCEAAGFNLVDVQKTPIHGTSYVFVLSPSRKMPERINNLIALEKQAGLLTKSTYVNWANTVKNNVSQLSSYGFLFRNRGFKLVGYGAAAKGNTLLNFSHLSLDFIIDDNALKQGTYSPGKRIPVVSIDELKKIPSTTPVLFVPLAWNFYDEIRRRILAVRSNTEDRFMRYFPEVVVE